MVCPCPQRRQNLETVTWQGSVLALSVCLAQSVELTLRSFPNRIYEYAELQITMCLDEGDFF